MQGKHYEWIVVGGGISGLSIAEMLCREGKSVLLIEKNEQLASETSKVFHEWMHSGALYSLAPDNLLTLRYLLGATDDLLEYYGAFPNMNMIPTEKGICVKNPGWFGDSRIEYRYRIHRLNPVWQGLVSRSINMIDLIENHDWLRRRAGSEYGKSKLKMRHWLSHIPTLLMEKSEFHAKMSPDVTMNSRLLLADLLASALSGNLEYVTGLLVKDIREEKKCVKVVTESATYTAENSVVCSPDLISQLFNIPIKIGYAPIAVVEEVPEYEKSFVELDYHVKKCINLLIKDGGFGQAGGITLDKEEEVEPYLNYIIKEHKKRNPSIRVIDHYVGIKKELVREKEERNYLYHINQISPRNWSVVLGKFSLAFSMAPEFFRRIYDRNPSKIIGDMSYTVKDGVISDTSWHEIAIRKAGS